MRKLSKLFIAIIIAIFISYNFIPIVSNALSIGNSECWGSTPASSQSSGGTGSMPDSGSDSSSEETTTTTTTDNTIREPWYNRIDGNVYDEGINRGIKDVLVKLVNEDGSDTGYSMRTDSSGNYSFEPAPGNYRVQFLVGNIDGIDENDTDRMKNILKYNGFDYYVSTLPSSSGSAESSERIVADTVTKKRIITMKKKATQVMLCVDYSTSSRNDDVVTQDGQTKKKLDVEIDATKKLIESLLRSDDSIYITLIAFDGGNHYRVLDKGLSRDQQKLYQGLEDARKVEVIGGTNIVAALDVANESYVYENKDDSNRILVLVTDGLPTGCYEEGDHIASESEFIIGDDKKDEVFLADDDINTRLEKLKNNIIPHTARKLKELKNDGIDVMSLVMKSSDEEDNEYISQIFNDDTTNLHVDINNGAELSEAIEKKVKEGIKKQNDEKRTESRTESESRTITTWDVDFQTEEEKNRSKEINANFDILNWGDTKCFQVIDNYTPDKIDMARELLDKTSFTITSNKNFYINSKPAEYTEKTKDEDGNEQTITHIADPITQTASLGLTEKETTEFKLKEYASALRVTLANGQVVYYKTAELKDDEEPKNVDPLLCFMDEEIAQGSKVEVEYTIHIAHSNATRLRDLRIMDYIPRGYAYDPDTELLSEKKKRNSDYWETQIDENELNDSNNFNTDYDNGKKIKEKAMGTNVKSRPIEELFSEPIDLKIVLEVTISGLDDYNKIASDYNDAEVYSYTSDDFIQCIDGVPMHSRMKVSTNATSKEALKGEFGGIHLFPASFAGADYQSSGDANIVTVLPPTGEPVDSKKTIGLIVALVSLDAVLITFLKKQLKLKNKNKK